MWLSEYNNYYKLLRAGPFPVGSGAGGLLSGWATVRWATVRTPPGTLSLLIFF